ncbi:MAG: Sigma-70, region 4, partial [Chloroflexota bacterium]|nr:Sigma-70, region 4 [Chloroflexota bacterium]
LDGADHPAPDRMIESEFWLWLDDLARALAPRQREVLFLRYRRDLVDDEIGAVMGLSPSGVRSLLGRAIQSLRDHPELLR